MKCTGLVTALALVLGCQARDTEQVHHNPEGSSIGPSAGTSTGVSISSVSVDSRAAAEQLDSRTPVPLLPIMAEHQKKNMRDHLSAVQEIVAALAVDDFAAIEKAVTRIGYSDSMGQMCNHMGTGAPGFSELAIQFHRNADKIAEAARTRDAKAVSSNLAQTLSNCTGCHEAFKQKIVGEAEWAMISQGPPHQHAN
jgi:hypothetical protein